MLTHTRAGFNIVTDVFYVLEKILKLFGNNQYFKSQIQKSAQRNVGTTS